MHIGTVEPETGASLPHTSRSPKTLSSIEVIVKTALEPGCDVNDIGLIEA